MDATGKWVKRGVWLTFAAVLTIGCNPITLPFVLLRTEAKIPATYPLRPKEGPKKDKDEEIKVLILASMAPGSTTLEFAGSERELAAAIAKKLPEVAKASKEEFSVIPMGKLDSFKQSNVNWRSMRAGAIGKRLGADYVIELSLSGLQMYQPGSLSSIYEGKAQVTVEVTDTAETSGEVKYHYVHSFGHPGFPRAVDSMPQAQFKLEFIEKLSTDIVFKHVDHKAAEGLGR
ncbi:MAG TPA: hypothetical protein VH092_02620 [Urbifossiella sp.]|nr:hypothetical protein [Urbifossiella sp.]